MDPEWEAAVKAGNASAIESKLTDGASVDARDRFGQTALMLSARQGHERCCRILVAAGADVDMTAKYGLSALMLAVVNHHETIARLLVESGADLTLLGSGVPGFAGKSAADLARDAGLDDLADLLSF